ncbi:MAG: PQQ-binding-like beta-propeller repeat protein [Candidatus Bathyarchaeota archaeon]|nr:PQQ-binding-like beta-propeller repeat protein [Candidatus Bathyarchaeota archaeon]
MQKNKTKTTIVALIAFVLMLTIVSASFVGVSYAPADLQGNRMTFPVHGRTKGVGPSPWWITDHEPYSFNQSSGGYNPYSTAPTTSHILWTWQKGPGGTVGGKQGTAYFEGGYFSSEVGDVGPAIGGRVYLRSGDDIVCLDEETGEVLFWKLDDEEGEWVGRTFAVFMNEIGWSQGRNIRRYELSSGEYIGSYTMQLSLNGIPIQGWKPEESPPVPFGVNTRSGERYFIGSSRLVINDHRTRVGTVAMVRLGAGDPVIWGPEVGDFVCAIWNDYVIGQEESYEGVISCLDRWTGEELWRRPFESYHSGGAGYGMYYVAGYDNYVYAFDLETGATEWVSEIPAESYYTEQGMAIGDGKVAFAGYAGQMYIFDAFDGSLLSRNYVGDNFEYEPYAGYYGTWPFQTPPIGADGKFYSVTGDHATPVIAVPGETLLAVDGRTGKEMWRFPAQCVSHGSQFLIADGLLIVMDGQGGQVLAFGKGESAVEVSVTEPRIAKGDYTWITGRITDQSPGQPGTAVVSKESMTLQMEYLHATGRKPEFGEITGVQAAAFATNTQGTFVDIGVVETDSEGYFEILWTPPSEDLWTVTVAFDGDESYWDSWGTADLAVGPSIGGLFSSSISSTAATFTAIAVVAVSAIYLVQKRRVAYRKEEIEK